MTKAGPFSLSLFSNLFSSCYRSPLCQPSSLFFLEKSEYVLLDADAAHANGPGGSSLRSLPTPIQRVMDDAAEVRMREPETGRFA